MYEKLVAARASAQARLESIQPIPMWNKIIGDGDAIEKPLKDLNRFIETTLNNKQSERRDSELKNYIEKNILKIEERMSAWIEMIESCLRTVLGNEQAKIIKNEIDARLSEDRNHWRVDFDDIKSTTKGYGIKSNSLVGRPATIALWNRDMKHDIYLGHYTNCCIRADSSALDGELTITDYLTDLGV